MDNPFDCRVMVSYLKQYFDSNVLEARGGSPKIGPLRLPSSTSYRVSAPLSLLILSKLLTRKKIVELCYHTILGYAVLMISWKYQNWNELS